MTLEDKTSDIMVAHAIEVDKYAISEKKRILSEFTFVLNQIKEELVKGAKKLSLADLRSMQSKASKIFLEGSKLIKANMFTDSEELMVVEAEEQVNMLQELIKDYLPIYNFRKPNLTITKRNIKDETIKGISVAGWLDIWETKTNNIIKSELYNAYTSGEEGAKDRYDIIEIVFGTAKNPLLADTFKAPTKQLGDLSVTLTGLTMAEVTSSISNANSSIIVGEQWNSCLCSTTCASCASLHGAINYYNGADETSGASIPLHPNCMCFWTYVYKDPKIMATQVAKDQKNNIKSNTDLPTFQVWYNSINEKRKIDLFGVTRAKMLEEGSIKISQLISSNNRKLYTLDDLKNKGYVIPK